MNESLRSQVRTRANDCCEYCQLSQTSTILPHEADHIRPQKHNGPTTLENLAWACAWCNSFKGSDLVGFDPDTDELTRLFDPRRQSWPEHFAWQEKELIGLTPIGRTTIVVLRINTPERVEHRRLWAQLR